MTTKKAALYKQTLNKIKMLFWLFLIFAVIPVVELAILIKVGSYLGVLNTVTIVILTAAIGAYMVKREGIGVMFRIQSGIQQGVFPGDELVNGALILVAGVLLLTPGFFTDVIGFILVFPASRYVIKQYVKRIIDKKISSNEIHINRF